MNRKLVLHEHPWRIFHTSGREQPYTVTREVVGAQETHLFTADWEEASAYVIRQQQGEEERRLLSRGLEK